MTDVQNKGEEETSTTNDENNDETDATITTPLSKSRSKKDCLSIWKQWVPMDRKLHASLQLAQVAMLQAIDELFHHATVPYWICGGTLLGVLRHNGRLIPHDDDIDIECYEQDLPQLAAAVLDRTDSSFDIRFVYDKTKTWEGHPVAKLTFWDGLLEVDIFPRPHPLAEGERSFPSASEVFPLARYALFENSLHVWGPNRDTCGPYLDRCYGPDWREVVCVWNHDYNWYHSAGFDARKQMLPLDDYNAIVEGADLSSAVARESAQATVQSFLRHCGGLEPFRDQYHAYCFQRTLRRNRAVADFREAQRDAEG